MASSASHVRQWKHNRDFLGAIPQPYPDWLVTAAFYVALHAVDALLAHDGVTRVIDHRTRNEVLVRTNRYTRIASLYLPLFDLSRTVRYLADPAKWVRAEDVEKDVLGRYLYPIEQS